MANPSAAVNLFVTCLLDVLFPQVAQCVVDIFKSQGLNVHVPQGQTCCGQVAYNGGHWKEARRMACHTIDVFEKTGGPVVVPSGSCAAMVRTIYPKLLQNDPIYAPKAVELAGRVYEFSEFLVDCLGITGLNAQSHRKVVYHPSCHALRTLHIDHQPRQLLAGVQGLQLLEQENPQTCCGFGGIFSVKLGDVSGAMLANRLAAFEATGAELVVGIDISCLMNIEGGSRKMNKPLRSMHLAQLLAEAMSLP